MIDLAPALPYRIGIALAILVTTRESLIDANDSQRRLVTIVRSPFQASGATSCLDQDVLHIHLRHLMSCQDVSHVNHGSAAHTGTKRR